MSLETAYRMADTKGNYRQRFGSYNTKVIVSGSTLEVYELTTKQRRGYENANAGTKKRSFSELSVHEQIESVKRKQKNLKQKRIDVMRVISTNFRQGLTKFVTLTFRDHVTDRAFAMNEFKKFMKRLNKRQKDKGRETVQYLGVIEYTKQGRIHFHVVLFNCAYIPKSELETVWENGFVQINQIHGMNGSAVARYVTKYMAKQFQNMEEDLAEWLRLGQETEKQKDYFTSRNLKKPAYRYLNVENGKAPDLVNGADLVKTSEYQRKLYLGDGPDGTPLFKVETVRYKMYELPSNFREKNIA